MGATAPVNRYFHRCVHSETIPVEGIPLEVITTEAALVATICIDLHYLDHTDTNSIDNHAGTIPAEKFSHAQSV